MKSPFVSRRRHEAELAAVNAERDRAVDASAAAQTTAGIAAAYFSAAGSVIACLERELKAVRAELAEARTRNPKEATP
jgi:hypothetical protein